MELLNPRAQELSDPVVGPEKVYCASNKILEALCHIVNATIPLQMQH